MPNPDSGNTDSKLGNTPPKFKRRASAPAAKVNERTAAWPGLAGPPQPRDRSAGVKKLKIHPMSRGI